MEIPLFFRCPISMELMQDPVTISTGVTYERKNIDKWLSDYGKTTCPATMQHLQSFDLTPNHTLKRLILSWAQPPSPSSPAPARAERDELAALLRKLDSTPFKVSCIRQLRAVLEREERLREDFADLGGVDVLGAFIFGAAGEGGDFAAFRACEEAVGVLGRLPLEDAAASRWLSRAESVRAVTAVLQRGSAEARQHAVAVLRKMAKLQMTDWMETMGEEETTGMFKALLELLSDEVCPKGSSAALDLLLEITTKKSRKNQVKAVEAGAICTFIELLPDANRHRSEKMLYLVRVLCECPEGRSAFVDHGLAIAVVSKKILRVSELATRLGMKILWLVCSFVPSERVLEEMVVYGAVKKMLALLHIDRRSSMKEKVMKMIKLHGNSWSHYPCFPSEFRDYLRLNVHDS